MRTGKPTPEELAEAKRLWLSKRALTPEPPSTRHLWNYPRWGRIYAARGELAKRTVPPEDLPGTDVEAMAECVMDLMGAYQGVVGPSDFEARELAEDCMRWGLVEAQRAALAARKANHPHTARAATVAAEALEEGWRRDADPRWDDYG